MGQKQVEKSALQNSNLFADLWELFILCIFVKYFEIKALQFPFKTSILDGPNLHPTELVETKSLRKTNFHFTFSLHCKFNILYLNAILLQLGFGKCIKIMLLLALHLPLRLVIIIV